MIIKNISIFNTSQKKFELGHVEIRGDKYWMVGNIDLEQIEDMEIIDGSGMYLIPGLIDIHMHIESSMTTPAEYSNTVLKKGTTTIVADSHEVANALGIEGLLEYMSSQQKLDIFYAIPSSVPSTNSTLETAKGYIGPKEVKDLCKFPKVRALGEIMNYKEVVEEKDNHTKRIIKAFKEEHPLYPVEGHIPLITGYELARYLHAGIGSDHTHQSVDSLIEKTRAGIQIQLQEKSMTEEIFKAIKKYHLEEFISFVSDDVMPDDLINKGHMDHLIRKAVLLGYPVEDAIYASTYIPAKRMLFFDRGIISPGRIADGVIIKDLKNFTIYDVIKSGQLVSSMEKDRQPEFSQKMNKSILRKKLKLEDLIIKTSGNKALVRVIERELKSTFTHEKHLWLDVEDGILQWKKAGLSLLAVFERYGKNQVPAIGFVANGFSKECAIATTWSHDSHNILAMATDEKLMLETVNTLIEKQGGMMIASRQARHFLPLTFGGVVSLEPMEVIASQLEKIRKEMVENGYQSHNEIMSFCVLALIVSPSLKISDKGYVDVRSQKLLDWRID
ncbi:MAG: adenine deaminase C-terminal domain-containing protein [Tissierellia bacterium]|nr:adenine deaminase C-terminal domain-containing protein [Tissierellia bacterium]